MAKRSNSSKEIIDPNLEDFVDFKVKKKKLTIASRCRVVRKKSTRLLKNMFLWILKEVWPGVWKCSRSGSILDLLMMMENVPRLFEVGDPDNLDFWVPRFINEVGRADGDPYPPRTIHQLLAGLQRSMLDHNNRLTKFLDRTNPVFRPIHGACDSV